MPIRSPLRFATLALLVGGLACAKNRANEDVGTTHDSTAAGMSDSTARMSDSTSMSDSAGMSDSASMSDSAKANQTKSGVTDAKTGKSTLGPGATQTRPDQGQPVTSKGDTINAAVDSSATAR